MTPELPVGNGQWSLTTLYGAAEEEEEKLSIFPLFH
jgi:hypothetical protein